MDSISELLATSAAGAWLTKTVVDLLRQRIEKLEGNVVLASAFVLGAVFNVLWTLYMQEPFSAVSDYARVAIQSVLAFLGAVGSTIAQRAADK